MIRDNPASRLLEILNEGKTKSSGTPCRAVWSTLLNTKSNSESLLISRLGKVMELPEQIIEELHKIPGTEKSDYSHWETQVNKAFMQQNLNSVWETFITAIDNHTITYLKMSKQLLSAHSLIKNISEDKLSKIQEQISALMQEIRESNLEIEIQSFLLSSLGDISNSINEYKISGYLPIVKNIDATVGHAVTNTEFKTKVNESNVGKKVWGTLQGLSTTITIASGVSQIPAAKNAIISLLTKL